MHNFMINFTINIKLEVVCYVKIFKPLLIRLERCLFLFVDCIVFFSVPAVSTWQSHKSDSWPGRNPRDECHVAIIVLKMVLKMDSN